MIHNKTNLKFTKQVLSCYAQAQNYTLSPYIKKSSISAAHSHWSEKRFRNSFTCSFIDSYLYFGDTSNQECASWDGGHKGNAIFILA